MEFLIDDLPDSVVVTGRQVPIETCFRAGIRFERIINGKADNMQKLEEAIRLYFPGQHFAPRDMPDAVDALLWFYRCGKDPPTEAEAAEAAAKRSPYRAFDFQHDAGMVYAAFLQAYRIDLTKQNIHWWQYRALFESLPDDTRLVKVIGYRTAEVPDGATEEQRQRIEKARSDHALPEDADLKQLKTDLENILRHGGNPAVLLEGGAANGLRRNT